MSTEKVPENLWQKLPENNKNVQDVTVGIKNWTDRTLQSASRVAFRRQRLIENDEHVEFDPAIHQQLDDLCLDFFRKTTGWFDEIIIIKWEWQELQSVYDFSLRAQNIEWIHTGEFIQLAEIGKDLSIWDRTWVNWAEGSSFDMVGKVSNEYLMCVNNTNASIDELEDKYPNRIFEEVKPIIERMIVNLKDILPA